jgi:hypothetical protein
MKKLYEPFNLDAVYRVEGMNVKACIGVIIACAAIWAVLIFWACQP